MGARESLPVDCAASMDNLATIREAMAAAIDC
jgi:hypothetical protein